MSERYGYCALFVDSEDRAHLLRLVADTLPGPRDGRTVSGKGLNVSVLRNKAEGYRADDFVTWPSKLELEQAGEDDASTVRLVRCLLAVLRDHGLKVVAACDFEDELPPQTFAG